MLNFLARRIVQLIPTLFFVSILIFTLQHLLPGGSALVMAGEERDPAVIAAIRKQYRLDQSIQTATIYIMLNLAADIAYILANPRLRG
jgi:peptide/nickel transport system permease protein